MIAASLPATADGVGVSISSSARAAAKDANSAVNVAGRATPASASSSNPASQLAGSDEHHERATIEAEVDEPDELQSTRGTSEDQRVDGCLPAGNTADEALGGLDVGALAI